MQDRSKKLAGEEQSGVEKLADAIAAGSRVALARAITLVESRKASHRLLAKALLLSLHGQGSAHRIGITGSPGVGKSTFIDHFGAMLAGSGRRVAVLAVDPSSTRTGGAILGDKTRMARLSNDPHAFIRPSPSSGTLGGVTRSTRETIRLCEAAGYNVVIVETVGVGQSEVAVAGMTDFFLLLMLAGGGDELQGIKKGIMELADAVAITKADGENELLARAAAADFQAALHILTPPHANWRPPVTTISSLTGRGLADLWSEVVRHRETLTASGEFGEKRHRQDLEWMHAMIEEQLRNALFAAPHVSAKAQDLELKVLSGAVPPSVAADEVVAAALAPFQSGSQP